MKPVWLIEAGVELSRFSGSWLYACDLKPVIAAANEIALGMSRKRND